MSWKFQREEDNFSIPAGDHRVIIESAEMAVSKAGNDMLVIKMAVSGYASSLWQYIVFMDDRPEITNRKLTELFDSFGIEDGDFDLQRYAGRAGAARVKIDDQGYPKVAFFIHKNKQGSLPPWKGDAPKPVVPAGFSEVGDDEDFPF